MVTTHKGPRLGSRLMGFMSAAALAGLCMFGAPAPAAQAQENCSFNWGIKESWRGYIQKKVFEGTWEKTSGVGFTGEKTGPDGAFVFTPKKATIDGPSTATIPMEGSLHFQSHKSKKGDFYLLDMKIYDIRVKASGSTAEIIADYDSYTWDGDIAATELGAPLKGDDEVLATIDLENPVNTDSGTVDLSGQATATSGTQRLFIADNYAAGESLDPTSGVVKLDGSCSSSSSSSSGGTSGSTSSGGGQQVCGKNFGRVDGEFTGANKEIMGMLGELNDTIGAVDVLMCNSTNLKRSVEEFTGVKPSSGGSNAGSGSNSKSGKSSGGSGTSGSDDSSESGSGNSGNDESSSGDSGSGTSDSSGTTAASTGAGASGTSGGGAGANDVCSADGARGVKSATTKWGIKKSFQSYITGSIAKGKWTLSGIKHQNGQFVFSGNSGAVDPSAKKGTIGSTGGVKFLGHKGLLDLQIFKPEIQFNGNQGTLVANVRSSDTSGKKTNYGRVTVANLKFSSLNVSDSQASGKASVFLTPAGAKAFAGFYDPGLELDPIEFSAKLGASANCASGQGAAAASSAGGDSNGSGPSADELKAQNAGASDDLDSSDDMEEISSDSDSDSSGLGYQDGKSQFKIKSSAADESSARGVGGTGLDPSAYVLLAAAALLLAGGSLGRLVLSHPA